MKNLAFILFLLLPGVSFAEIIRYDFETIRDSDGALGTGYLTFDTVPTASGKQRPGGQSPGPVSGEFYLQDSSLHRLVFSFDMQVITIPLSSILVNDTEGGNAQGNLASFGFRQSETPDIGMLTLVFPQGVLSRERLFGAELDLAQAATARLFLQGEFEPHRLTSLEGTLVPEPTPLLLIVLAGIAWALRRINLQR